MKITKDDLETISKEVYDDIKSHSETNDPMIDAMVNISINVIETYFEKVIEKENS